MKWINLTPHPIRVYDQEGKNVLMEIPSSGVVRVSVSQTTVKTIDGIPVKKTTFGDVEGLPEPKEGVVYIVSMLVLQALKSKGIDRDDIVAPDTSPSGAVRDSQGRIIGVKGFQIL